MKVKKSGRFKIAAIASSLLIFVLSLSQDAITYIDFDGQKNMSSLSMLLSGSLSVLGGGMAEWITWLANPIYFLSIILYMGSKKACVPMSVISTSIALSFLAWKELLVSESGRIAKIQSHDSGYWLWVLSLSLLSFATVYSFTKSSNDKSLYLFL